MPNLITHFDDHWETTDSLKIHAEGWAGEEPPRAVVGLVHGIGEHIGRYAHVGQFLAQSGYACMGFDLRGHGRSGGGRGHTPHYQALLDDIAIFLDRLQARYPGSPVFLYGHSLGGNLALNFVLRRKPELTGVVASAPALRLAFEPPPAKVALAYLMNRVLPAFSQSSGLETAALSREAKIVQAYINDPLVHDRVSARMFVGFYQSGLWALQNAHALSVPVLLIHGSADRLTSVEASREFARKAGEMCTLQVWQGLYHEMHNEPEQGEVLEFVLSWMEQRLHGE